MRDSFVPSLREYAQRYQITAARLRPGQLLMHPGPVNRGVELSGEAIDSPQALIGEQVRAGRGGADGGAVRAARRSPEPGGGGVMSDDTQRLFHRAGRAGRAADRRRARARPAHRARRAARHPDPRRPDRRARRAGVAVGGRSVIRIDTSTPSGKHAFPGVRRPARAPAHAGPGVQGEPRDRHGGRGRRRVLRGDRDAEHRPGRRRRVGPALADRRAHADRRASRSGSWPRSRADLKGDELTEMAELRDAGALGFTDDGKPVVHAGTLRKALQYQRLCGGVIALHEEDPALSGDGVMHEGAVSARLGHRRDPVAVGVDDGRARRRAGRLRGRPRPLPAPVVRRVGGGARAGQEQAASGSAPRSARTT